MEHLDSTLIAHAIVHISRIHRWCQGAQRWDLFSRGQPLGAAEIRTAEAADNATRPGLRGNPGDRVGPIVAFLKMGVECTLGGKPPPHILNHNHVACLHRTQDVEGAGTCECVFLIIGRAREEHRRWCFSVQPIHVGCKLHSIAHRHHHVFLNQYGCHACPPYGCELRTSSWVSPHGSSSVLIARRSSIARYPSATWLSGRV